MAWGREHINVNFLHFYSLNFLLLLFDVLYVSNKVTSFKNYHQKTPLPCVQIKHNIHVEYIKKSADSYNIVDTTSHTKAMTKKYITFLHPDSLQDLQDGNNPST